MISKAEQAIPLYRSLMEEIKIRYDHTDALIKRPPQVPVRMLQEFCWLQLRMLCELIALGCLVANGDINKSNKLTKVYQADRIMDTLEELHPDFYPKPVTQHVLAPGRIHHEPVRSGYMTKSELIKLYNQKCGHALHRGNLKRLLSTIADGPGPMTEITGAMTKVQRLMDCHMIMLAGGNAALMCAMNTAEGISVAFAKRIEHGDLGAE